MSASNNYLMQYSQMEKKDIIAHPWNATVV